MGIGSIVAITVRPFSLGCGSACCVIEPLEGFSIGHVVDWLDVLRSCGLNARLVQNTEAST